ncbi:MULTISPECIES: succinate dehydrogenase, hydrophobic membrane anchor protein [Novosphingobium]|uniref:Succinate dehydrogenase hydrophobic membrane anchor subunit n=2 Tax=Novosphingobium TaxID=165696 RepID=A0ABT0A7A5_9SPHN|nr:MULTISPECIES: succinate dehydrogenase, hydrophobic membrane anchor protein [Novosphingobium]MCJ1959066.1 succinate dehydrogenase, hydrophobic membrane anchor protein [Novosphingobium mangrovi (ex Hu et al. 2023)]QVM85839.1 succinate dehydrogenase, hydrophobic membrane anchor protein [Novosphingobium decolorationis]GAM07208.1 succinate dehydrogenase hydrophobic membrane anchor protein [Novosphingobium sp. MBES04]
MGNGTSIGRVRGLGSAKHGAHHWLIQRFTAVGNLFLMIWLAASILLLDDLSYVTVIDWISAPVPAVAMGLLIVSTFWHARLGVQVMMEDYVHDHGTKFACLAALNIAVFAGAAFGVLCVLRLALGA